MSKEKAYWLEDISGSRSDVWRFGYACGQEADFASLEKANESLLELVETLVAAFGHGVKDSK